jgi:SynChlorMet cassette protein ScmD
VVCLRIPVEKGYGTTVINGEKPIANPLVVLREEFDDWAIVFDPDTGSAFGLSPTGVYLWKHLDGEHSIDDMLEALHGDAADVPEEAGGHLAAFVEELTRQGLAGYDVEAAHDDWRRIPPRPECAGTMAFNYQAPKLINLSGEQAEGACCFSGSSASGESSCCSGACVTYSSCYGGTCAGGDCQSGTSALGTWCSNGNSPYVCGSGTSTIAGNCAGTGYSAASRCNDGSGGRCATGSSG